MFMALTTPLRRAGFVGLALAVIGTTAQAQESDYGKRLFMENCAACHGAMGEGDGAVGALFGSPPGSLRLLEEKNNGHYPFSEVYQTINGTRELRAHGSIEMPVWGSVFREEAIKNVSGIGGEEVVQGRILALVYFLQSIQE